MKIEYKQRIKDLREDDDKTQEVIAKYLGIRQNVYSRYERGENKIPVDYIIKLCYFYNCSADYILGLTNEKKPLPKK